MQDNSAVALSTTEAADSAKPKRKRRAAKVRPTIGSIRERHGAWHWEYYVERKRKMERLGSTDARDSDYLKNKQEAVDAANKRFAQRGASNAQKGSQRLGTIQIV